MSSLVVPAEGIALVHERLDGKNKSTKHPQLIQLNLLDHITKDILKSLRNNEKARVRFGRKPVINFGKKSVVLEHGSDEFVSELFVGQGDGSEPLYFSGTLSHTLEVQQAKEATAGADAALANLSNTLKSLQEERASHEAGIVPSRLSKKDHRPSPLVAKDRFRSGSTPSTPYLSAGFSPRLGPTSAPLVSNSSQKDKVRLEAIKIPMIHLLAIGPMTPKAIAEKLHLKQAECDRALQKFAMDSRKSTGKKELKDKSYRDLNAWKFPYQSQNDRQAAIDHAVTAFDRMRIEKSDPLWQMLLAEEDRRKGINLSRLNFDKPIMPGNSTPRLPERSTDGGSTEGKSMTSHDQDGQGKKVKESPAKAAPKSRDTPATTSTSRSLKHDAKKTALPKSSPKANKTGSANKPAQTETKSKFKSAERIEDSDEEAEAAETITVARKHGNDKHQEPARAISKQSPTKNVIPASTRPPHHKPRLSDSSGGGSDTPLADTLHKKVKPTADNNTRKSDTSNSKASPRPRNGSSPQKPSPLGSSPPTNSTDADNSSNSSKGGSQSSAPSSPPSSTESNEPRRGTKYSPIISERRQEKMANGVHKRKAEATGDQPASKRQQMNGTHHNVLPKGLSDHMRHAPVKTTGGFATRSPQKQSLSKNEVIENGRWFLKRYSKYKELHERLNKVPEKERDDSEVDNLWKLHVQLEDMKAHIWRDWELVKD